MFLKLLLIPFIAISILWAQSEENMPDMSQVKEMVTIKWEPAGKNIRVFLTGYEAAKIKFHDMYIEASYGIGDFKKNLTVNRKSDSFLIANPKSYKDIKLKVKVKDEEAFDYDIKLK
ncbi:MAG: hypothetical protein KDD58_13485 [Bdellovibrionales bacterium]|nr:hypothetical protein [Bdellovibrionales bacterium]